MELKQSLPTPPDEYKKQVYVPEDDVSSKDENDESNSIVKPKSETPLGDTYDLYDMATKIHSPVNEITKDFTLSDLSSEVINNKLPKFIREQLKVMKIIEQYLIVSIDELEKRYNPNYAKKIHRRLKEINNDVKNVFLNEIYSMVIMSRSVNGKILKAILLHSKSQEQREEFDSSTNNSIMSKLNEQRK